MFPLKAKMIDMGEYPHKAKSVLLETESILRHFLPIEHEHLAGRLMHLSRADIQRRMVTINKSSREYQLAWGFIRLRPYRMIENKSKVDKNGKLTNPPHWGRVEDLIVCYSDDDQRAVRQRLEQWRVSTEMTLSDDARAELNRRWVERRAAKSRRGDGQIGKSRGGAAR